MIGKQQNLRTCLGHTQRLILGTNADQHDGDGFPAAQALGKFGQRPLIQLTTWGRQMAHGYLSGFLSTIPDVEIPLF